LSAFFLGSYINLYERITGMGAVRAIFLTIGLCVWNDLTYKLLPSWYQKTQRQRVGAIYAFGLVNIVVLLLTRTGFDVAQGDVLSMMRTGIQPPDIIYGVFQVLASASILYNFRVGAKVRAGLQSRQFFVASLLVVSAIVYGVLALAVASPMPRFIPDALAPITADNAILLKQLAMLGRGIPRIGRLMACGWSSVRIEMAAWKSTPCVLMAQC
jgi:hypothetical protein